MIIKKAVFEKLKPSGTSVKIFIDDEFISETHVACIEDGLDLLDEQLPVNENKVKMVTYIVEEQ